MKKLLIGILLLGLGALLYKTATTGFSSEIVEMYSLVAIKDKSETLGRKMEEITQITSNVYPQKSSELSKNIKELETEKQRYNEKAQYSSTEEVAKANMTQTYQGDYLWVTLGNYATREGIVAKLEFNTSTSGIPGLYDIKFTLNGAYTSITEYIYSIENDSKLNFRIENFTLVPGGGTTEETATEGVETTAGSDVEKLQSTFVVKDLAVEF